MAIPHAQPGEKVDVRPLGDRLGESATSTLVKTEALELIRLVVPAGKTIPPHQVPGEISVQCLEGRVEFSSGSQTTSLAGGELLYLAGGEPHSLTALEDASLLVTILLEPKSSS